MTQYKKTKKAELKAILAKAQKEKKSKSQVAQEMQKQTKTEQVATTNTVKERDVKEFVKTVAIADLDKDSRAVIKQRRRYMLTELDDKTNAEIYNATMYRNEKNELVLFSQKYANKFVLDYVQKLANSTKFDAQDIMSILKTCGGAYGDKVRNALYSISYMTTAKDIEKDINSVIAIAQAKNKLCIYYDIYNNESRRVKYDFIRV